MVKRNKAWQINVAQIIFNEDKVYLVAYFLNHWGLYGCKKEALTP